jgi:hypothetical protein
MNSRAASAFSAVNAFLFFTAEYAEIAEQNNHG